MNSLQNNMKWIFDIKVASMNLCLRFLSLKFLKLNCFSFLVDPAIGCILLGECLEKGLHVRSLKALQAAH